MTSDSSPRLTTGWRSIDRHDRRSVLWLVIVPIVLFVGPALFNHPAINGDNLIQNNVFIDCPKAIHVDARARGWCGPHADGRIKEAQQKGTIAGIRYNEPPYSTRYPLLAGLLADEPKKPKGNIVRRNIFWQGPGEDLRRVAQGAPIKENWWNDIEPGIRALVKLEDNLINVDPHFVDPQSGNYQLRADSPAWPLGFQRIPVEQIGLVQDINRASWPVQHPVRALNAQEIHP